METQSKRGEGGERIKVGVVPLFSTWIYQCQNGSAQLNAGLEELARRLMKDERNGTTRTNRGGWHYAFDVFELKEPVIEQFRNYMEHHVQTYLNHFRPEGQKKKDRFRRRGWMNVNRPEDFNTLHWHPGCFLYANYYVKVAEK